MLVKPMQFRNAPSPMLVTPSGIVTFPEQAVPSINIPFTITSESFSCCLFVNQGVPENASSPMLVTLFGMVMLVKPVQSENALAPMLLTPSGISILVKPVHS